MEKITYTPLTFDQIAVFLAGKRVGTMIKATPSGWQYTPKGSKRSGDVFPTLQLCIQSLEAQ
jgi:hypothetical protein